MKKIRILPLFLVLCLFMTAAAPTAAALDEPDLVAKSVVLADIDSGRILYSKNMDEQVSPASLTKITTALLAVESIERGEHDWDEMVTAQEDCRRGMDESSSTAGIMPGETMSLKNLIYCAMIISANEACNIIGSYLAGSIDAFVEQMNQRVAELGCTNTHFANPNGLTAEGHYSSAHDQYIITRAAISDPVFMEICSTIEYTVPATNMAEERHLANSNALMSPNSIYNTGGNYYVYEGAAGVKTGYTRAAGYCIISTVKRDNINLLSVVMGSTGPLNSDREEYGNFEDATTLYDWCFDNFSYQKIISTEKDMGSFDVQFAKDDARVHLHPQEEIELLLPNDTAPEDIELRPEIFTDKLVAPIEVGDVLGEAELFVAGESYGKVRLAADSPVELSRGEYMKQRLSETFGKTWVKVLLITVLVIVLAYTALVSHYRRLRRRHLAERRRAEQRRRAERERYYAQRDEENVSESTQRFDRIDPSDFPEYTDEDSRYDDIFRDR